MKIKIIFIAVALLNCVGFAGAQQAGTKPQSAPAKQISLPNGKLTDPVQLRQGESEPSAFDQTLNFIGKNLRQSFELTLETFLPFQFKYAIMLDESVEKLTNVSLYKTIDEWYGTRYRYGGTSHRGIDCSAFMQVLGEYALGWMLPRTAREQYASLSRIDTQELKEGDLVFFNTTGGVSHVGMYLQNGKFIHSCTSQGVSISNLDDKYWKARYLGARRAPLQQSIPDLLKDAGLH